MNSSPIDLVVTWVDGEEEQYMDKFCKNKFRTAYDINHWIFRYWRFVTGKFVPIILPNKSTFEK